MSAYRRYPKYESIAEIQARNEQRRALFLKRHKQAHPLIIEGKNVSSTWWGKAWNENLSRYSDYANRLVRGRRYVRGGAVFDIEICAGKIVGYVSGSGNKTYHIEINIDACKIETLLTLMKRCDEQFHSLQDLLDGNFPIVLKELLLDQRTGLFPSPQEIHIHCTCPDYAVVCKHVAALLYAVSVKLDQDPSLFFLLRQIHLAEFMNAVAKKNAQHVLQEATQKHNRTIEIEDIQSVFHLS